MIPSTNEKTVLIIVDPKTGQSRSFRIHAPHLQNFRYYIGGLILVFGLLIAACWILYTTAHSHQARRNHLEQRVAALEEQIPKPADSLRMQQYVKDIEGKLRALNNYLNKRGVKGFAQRSVGGNETGTVKLAPELYYSSLDQYLERIFEGIIYTPLGLPAKSEVTSNFGYRRNPFSNSSMEFHSGIDFRGQKGDQVRSTAGGRVVQAGWNNGYGNCIQIKHQGGYETLYAHLSDIGVKIGDKIAAGQVIGKIGSTGRSSGSHLHYEVRRNGNPVNPLDFLELN